MIPTQASSSRLRSALGGIVLTASFFVVCALLLEATAQITMSAVPVSVVVIATLLFWVIEPKLSARLRMIVPNRRTVGASLAWAVRVLGTLGALIVFGAVMLQIPVSIFAAITLASGLLFLGGLLVTLSEAGPPTNHGEQRRRQLGTALIVLGMLMTFSGSFGVSFLFDLHETGTRRIIREVLFGPVFYLQQVALILTYPYIGGARTGSTVLSIGPLTGIMRRGSATLKPAVGLPVFLFGLWLLGRKRG